MFESFVNLMFPVSSYGFPFSNGKLTSSPAAARHIETHSSARTGEEGEGEGDFLGSRQWEVKAGQRKVSGEGDREPITGKEPIGAVACWGWWEPV